MSNSKNKTKVNIIIFGLLFLLTIGLIGLNFIEVEKPYPSVFFDAQVAGKKIEPNGIIEFKNVGEKKQLKIVNKGSAVEYSSALLLDHNFENHIKITDLSEEQFNTHLELELVEKTLEELSITFIDLSVNNTLKINIDIEILYAVDISLISDGIEIFS